MNSTYAKLYYFELKYPFLRLETNNKTLIEKYNGHYNYRY